MRLNAMIPAATQGAGPRRSCRAIAALCCAILGVMGAVQEVSAGPLDGRAVRCSVNTNGGRGPSGTWYDAFTSNQHWLPIGRSSWAPTEPKSRGEVLFAAQTSLYRLDGGAQGQVSPLYNCPPGVMEQFQGNGSLLSGSTDIYKTNIQGIGYRVYYYYIDANDNQLAPVTYSNPYASGVLAFPFDSDRSRGAMARIEFVATGEEIVPGTLSTVNVYGSTTVTGAGVTLPAGLYRIGVLGNVAITRPTCAVTNTAALNLTLPDATIAAVKGGNAGFKSTTLQVRCTAKGSAAPTMSISGTTISGYPATLSNVDASGTRATGVGVKLWVYDVTSGDFRVPTMGLAERNLGSAVGALPTTDWTYQVGASYQQVNTTLTAGPVRATATLTFTYS